jgi:hypothetical protein
MEAPAPLKPPEITSPLKSEPQALIFQHPYALHMHRLYAEKVRVSPELARGLRVSIC